MSGPAEHVPAAPASRTAVERDAVLWWHGGWAAALLVSGAALSAFLGLAREPALAILAGIAPALAAFGLMLRDGPRERAALLALWAVAAVAACVLTGGITGPLAAWCLAPVAAATLLGGASLLAEAAAVGLLAAALAAVAQIAGATGPQPTPGAAFWLAITSMTTTAVGLGAGLLLSRRAVLRARAVDAAGQQALAALLTEQPHLVLVLAADGQVEAAFGQAPDRIDPDQLRARGLLAIAHAPDRPGLQAALRRAELDGEGRAGFSPADALHHHAILDVRRAADGRLVGVLRDAGLEHAREASLEQARQDAEALNAGKSRFLANMSHELRTPLNAIMGFSDIMRSRMFGELPGKYVEYAELIHESGRHLLDLINDVLDMSKIEAARYELAREVFDAREPVSAALRLMRLQADEAGVQLRGMLPGAPLEVDADRRALKQIVLNLVSNALKFTPKGGSVTVSGQAVEGMLEITVADTGVGIPPEDVERLGRPYEQAGGADQKARGTGLGLSLVRAFAELHGGDMGIESRLGEGTAVMVRLPVLAAQAGGRASTGNVIAFNPQR
ncbi:HAMP domain-containing sensor histidine kinase [Caulobacter sp. CCUG 60055]|uniref:sensor histidine kinase n=1 Tax=Caulobacter sp. CCUG 60055 TaxID=2100090 RepID=UPI00325AD0CA